MLNIKSNSAIETGQNSLLTKSTSSVKRDTEEQLLRILERVPPIIALPSPKRRCPYTGQSRTSLMELVAPCPRNSNRPPVKAIYKRAHKYATRGRWLIPSENLFRYLLSLSENSTDAYLKLARERKSTRTV